MVDGDAEMVDGSTADDADPSDEGGAAVPAPAPPL